MNFEQWLKENHKNLYNDFSEVSNLKKLRDWLEVAFEDGVDYGFSSGFDYGFTSAKVAYDQDRDYDT